MALAKLKPTYKRQFRKYLIFIFILCYVLNKIIYPSYITITPTIPIYPNNKDEIDSVKSYTIYRTKSDVAFFYKTNESVSNAFLPYVKESIEELNDIISSCNGIIFLFKYLINRPRPSQIDPSIAPIDTSTALTPSYPAGHAYQAYYLSKVLAKRYPHYTNLFIKIAHDCDFVRVKAGLHFPSDGEFSKYLVSIFHS